MTLRSTLYTGIQGYFYEEDDTPAQETITPDLAFQRTHKPPSKWTPQKYETNPSIYNFATELQHHLRELEARRHIKDNLSKQHLKALRRLKNQRDIVIKPADKGSGVVLLTPEQYEAEADRQLSNEEHYKQLQSNPLPSIQT